MRGIIGSRRFRVAAAVALAAAAVGGSAGSSAAPEAVVPCSASSLISSISTANTTPADSSITLTSGYVYTLTAPDNTTDGGTGLPVITGQVSVAGSATIARSAAAGTAAFRIFDVGPGGSLTLNSVTLSHGLADDAAALSSPWSCPRLMAGSQFRRGPATAGTLSVVSPQPVWILRR